MVLGLDGRVGVKVGLSHSLMEGVKVGLREQVQVIMYVNYVALK